eukprot:Phypoly_transcript_09889.p1 GENE.Phypoly_transcript_09889~~Phypoly_transcript_09889.p1  ORF type:complete len:356 (+),score=51.84 Phypoly_transcript_09889:279-1346(+)
MGVYNKVQPLPSNVTLSQITQTIPKEAFEKDTFAAVRSIIVTVLAVAFGEWVISICPVWFLPFAWFYTGTAATGLFVLGHDCGHRSLVKSLFWNDLIGTVVFLPLLFPFHPWRIKHNVHHQHTNKMDVDTAWHPITEEYFNQCSAFEKWGHRITRGPVWFVGSVGHWIWEHFSFKNFKPDDMPKVKSSVQHVNYYSLLFFPVLFYYVGVWGIIKYWFVPFLGFHFWMSTFTLVHHTAPHIPFLPEEKWNPAVAQLQHTIHCKYPAWIDFLTHDISVHIPHHVSTGIPHYKLRLAYASLKKNWGPYIHECEFSFDLMWQIIANCQIHDDETKLYKTFSQILQKVGIINPKIDVKHD